MSITKSRKKRFHVHMEPFAIVSLHWAFNYLQTVYILTIKKNKTKKKKNGSTIWNIGTFPKLPCHLAAALRSSTMFPTAWRSSVLSSNPTKKGIGSQKPSPSAKLNGSLSPFTIFIVSRLTSFSLWYHHNSMWWYQILWWCTGTRGHETPLVCAIWNKFQQQEN